MKNFSAQTRSKNIQKLQNEEFDLLIIGGGITGAGVARDAAQRGMRVALVEANDFAYGTSSRSSKLVHGGIRYLENMEFKLVFEALTERAKLFALAPHLTHPLRFVIPLYENSRVGMFKMGLGMILYDVLALFNAPEMHERLNAHATMDRYPIVNSKDLIGSYVYSDGYMDDDRLVHETLRSANEYGAVCVNYAQVASAHKINGKIDSLNVTDLKTNQKFTIKAKHVVSTVGPWTDLVGEKLVQDWKKILRPTKGIHLTFLKEKLNLESAVVMAAEKSERIVFAIPRHEMVIIGTTDTDFKDHPENVSVTPEDVEYLLKITNQYFPGANLTVKDIVSSYAGVRPLVQDDSSSEGKTSREHTIMHDPSGITFVAGGKYTTYRLMSEDIVDQALKFFSYEKRVSLKRCETTQALNEFTTEEKYAEALSETKNAEDSIQQKLAIRHGMEYKNILAAYYAKYTTYWQFEAAHAIQTTMCLSIKDFYCRRVPLFLSQKDHGVSLLNEIAEVFQREYTLPTVEIEKQKNELYDYIKKELSWMTSFNLDPLKS
ncbi:MAG: glycerol-3-phosphate dehydrogenase/oxidase [Bdellovibrionaceae bacterium]|nr:glycerol-3-phosphate dehydrogenase/oxidase [Pseudobdellovibrionaceae bacterium]